MRNPETMETDSNPFGADASRRLGILESRQFRLGGGKLLFERFQFLRIIHLLPRAGQLLAERLNPLLEHVRLFFDFFVHEHVPCDNGPFLALYPSRLPLRKRPRKRFTGTVSIFAAQRAKMGLSPSPGKKLQAVIPKAPQSLNPSVLFARVPSPPFSSGFHRRVARRESAAKSP